MTTEIDTDEIDSSDRCWACAQAGIVSRGTIETPWYLDGDVRIFDESESTTQCADCNAMLMAYPVGASDAQIRELMAEAERAGDNAQATLCRIALGEDVGEVSAEEARMICAEAIADAAAQA